MEIYIVADQSNRLLNPLLKDQAMRSMLSKMVEPIDPRYGPSRGDIAPPDDMTLRSVSDNTTANIMDAKSIFQLLPDVELAANILSSSILSPKDMINVHLNIGIEPGTIDPEVAAPILEVIKDYFLKDYKIEEQLEKILKDILFYRGSYPIAIIPEGSIDRMINGGQTISKESLLAEFSGNGFLAGKGILGSPKAQSESSSVLASMESLLNEDLALPADVKVDLSGFKDELESRKIENSSEALKDIKESLFVVDNFEILRIPAIRESISRQQLQQKLNIRTYSSEAKKDQPLSQAEERALENKLYIKQLFKHVPAMAVPVAPNNAKDYNHGHPLAMDLPSESVIPVHVPSYPEKHIGYFILLDISGNPIANATRTDHYSELSQRLTVRREVTQASMAGSAVSDNVFSNSIGRFELDNMARAYGRIVEADLLTRIKNGIRGGDVAIDAPQEVWRVMLARSLAKQKTQMLYIPKELMVYMAFDFNEYGVGSSLIEQTKVISSLRATLMFANTLGAVKNSVGRTNVNITLDEKDTNPAQTVEQLLHSYVNGNSARFPIGTASAKSIIDFLQRAGIGVQVSGNSRYPATSISVDDKSTQKVLIDNELTENLKKQQTMAFGLSPDMVDSTLNVEFAASIVNSHLMLAKSSFIKGKMFCGFLKEFFIKYTENSSILMQSMRDVIADKKVKMPKEIAALYESSDKDDKTKAVDMTDARATHLIYYILDNLKVNLPMPDNASMEVKVSALETYTKGIDIMLDAMLASAMYNEDADGLIAGKIDQYREIIKGAMIKMWAMENDFMPEMFDLLEEQSDGTRKLDLVKTQGESMTEINDLIVDFIIFADKEKKAREKRLQKAGIEPEETEDDGLGGGDDLNPDATDGVDGLDPEDDTDGAGADVDDGEIDDVDPDATDDDAVEPEADDKSDKDDDADDVDIPELPDLK